MFSIPDADRQFEATILDIARRVPHDKYHELANNLGFEYNYADSVLATKCKDYVQASATLLMEWKAKHGSGPLQKAELKRILESTEIGAVAAALDTEQTQRRHREHSQRQIEGTKENHALIGLKIEIEERKLSTPCVLCGCVRMRVLALACVNFQTIKINWKMKSYIFPHTTPPPPPPVFGLACVFVYLCGIMYVYILIICIKCTMYVSARSEECIIIINIHHKNICNQ